MCMHLRPTLCSSPAVVYAAYQRPVPVSHYQSVSSLSWCHLYGKITLVCAWRCAEFQHHTAVECLCNLPGQIIELLGGDFSSSMTQTCLSDGRTIHQSARLISKMEEGLEHFFWPQSTAQWCYQQETPWSLVWTSRYRFSSIQSGIHGWHIHCSMLL